jgi:hypothetical protein
LVPPFAELYSLYPAGLAGSLHAAATIALTPRTMKQRTLRRKARRLVSRTNFMNELIALLSSQIL